MSQRYAVRYDGPLTSVTEHPDGPWLRWEAARAVIEQLEDQVRECLMTLECLRRAASFYEYEILMEEMAAGEEPRPEPGEIA